jgi:hypothetical protein
LRSKKQFWQRHWRKQRNQLIKIVDTIEESGKTEKLPEGTRPGSFSSAAKVTVRVVDPLTDASWDQAVSAHPQSNIFHSTAWARVLNKTYGHIPIYLQFCRGTGTFGLVPMMEVISSVTGRRGVSLPFSDFCEPLPPSEPDADLLLDKLVELARERKWDYFQLRGGRGNLPTGAIADVERFYGHKLDLSVGRDSLFGGFDGSVRRAVRKAENCGIRIEISSARKAMLDFYYLHVRTRGRHGLPPQSLSFFLNIDEEIMKRQLGFIVLAKRQNKPIAGAVFFCSRDTALFKFGASDERTHQFRGNNLVMWEGIRHLVGKGLKTLHFGRTALNNAGLRRFKLSWGTEEEVIEYFRFALSPQRWLNSVRNASDFHNQLFRSLPPFVNRFAGALIYSHLD